MKTTTTVIDRRELTHKISAAEAAGATVHALAPMDWKRDPNSSRIYVVTWLVVFATEEASE